MELGNNEVPLSKIYPSPSQLVFLTPENYAASAVSAGVLPSGSRPASAAGSALSAARPPASAGVVPRPCQLIYTHRPGGDMWTGCLS